MLFKSNTNSISSVVIWDISFKNRSAFTVALKSLISSYTDFDLCSFSGNINTDDLLTQDPILLEYICNKSKSDYLLIDMQETNTRCEQLAISCHYTYLDDYTINIPELSKDPINLISNFSISEVLLL